MSWTGGAGGRGPCEFPPPVAEEGNAQVPQPRHWRPVVEQGREWHCGKAGKAGATVCWCGRAWGAGAPVSKQRLPDKDAAITDLGPDRVSARWCGAPESNRPAGRIKPRAYPAPRIVRGDASPRYHKYLERPFDGVPHSRSGPAFRFCRFLSAAESNEHKTYLRWRSLRDLNPRTVSRGHRLAIWPVTDSGKAACWAASAAREIIVCKSTYLLGNTMGRIKPRAYPAPHVGAVHEPPVISPG